MLKTLPRISSKLWRGGYLTLRGFDPRPWLHRFHIYSLLSLEISWCADLFLFQDQVLPPLVRKATLSINRTSIFNIGDSSSHAKPPQLEPLLGRRLFARNIGWFENALPRNAFRKMEGDKSPVNQYHHTLGVTITHYRSKLWLHPFSHTLRF